MAELDGLAARFEVSRPRLRAVAYRMLGSASEADDAIQEAWPRGIRFAGPGPQPGWSWPRQRPWPFSSERPEGSFCAGFSCAGRGSKTRQVVVACA